MVDLSVVFESLPNSLEQQISWEQGMWLLLNACDVELSVQAIFMVDPKILPESLAKKFQQLDLYDILGYLKVEAGSVEHNEVTERESNQAQNNQIAQATQDNQVVQASQSVEDNQSIKVAQEELANQANQANQINQSVKVAQEGQVAKLVNQESRGDVTSQQQSANNNQDWSWVTSVEPLKIAELLEQSKNIFTV